MVQVLCTLHRQLGVDDSGADYEAPVTYATRERGAFRRSGRGKDELNRAKLNAQA
jgi:hypothetical protein